jgi:hypothetical protein
MRILKVINDQVKNQGISCLPCDLVNLDIERFTEYRDSDEHPAEVPFERPVLTTQKKKIVQLRIPTILKFFLDGSRRTYKVADINDNGKYLPLVAGQVGVGVLQRDDDGKSCHPLRSYCRYDQVIAFPDNISTGDLNNLQDAINQRCSFPFKLLRYERKPDGDPVDLGVARIMKHMQDLEVECVVSLSNDNLLQNDSLLVIDGPLRFKEMRGRSFDVVQFRNVIGLSKSFRPSYAVGKGRGRKDIGSIASALDFGERTSTFKTTEGERAIGMWYLRIRPPQMMSNPLQGVVKLECYAISPADREDGLDGDRVDVISSHILHERNVTPYGADQRWANHIYPIYMAETYIKSSFVSDIHFTALF